MGKIGAVLATVAVAALLGGCVSVKAPREINVGGSSKPPPVDSSRVPRTSSHEDCRHELEKAYQNIQYLEREVSHWKEKADEYKRERDRCEDKLENCEDKLENCQDRLEKARERD